MRRFTDLYGNLPARVILASVLNAKNKMGKNQIPPVLLQGDWGTGKSLLADLYAAGSNCTQHSSGPCGDCSSCKLSQSGKHPAILKILCRQDPQKSVEAAFLFVTMALGPLTRVLILEDVDALEPRAILQLAGLLDTLPEKVAVVMTSHTSPDPSILSHATSIHLRNMSQEEAMQFAESLTEGAPEKIPASHVATAYGNPRVVRRLAETWNFHPFVEEPVDHSVTILRAVLTGNIEGGMVATYEHVQDGGTYSEAVTALLGLITSIMEVRTVGSTKDPLMAELAGLQTEAQALAMLRTLWNQSAVSFVVDPVVRLRTLFSLLCSVAHPQKFVVRAPVTVVEEKTPPAPEISLVSSISAIEALAGEAFGSTG